MHRMWMHRKSDFSKTLNFSASLKLGNVLLVNSLYFLKFLYKAFQYIYTYIQINLIWMHFIFTNK